MCPFQAHLLGYIPNAFPFSSVRRKMNKKGIIPIKITSCLSVFIARNWELRFQLNYGNIQGEKFTIMMWKIYKISSEI